MTCNAVHFGGCSYPYKVTDYSPWSRHHETCPLKPRELPGGKLLADNPSAWSESEGTLTCLIAVGLPRCHVLLSPVEQAGH